LFNLKQSDKTIKYEEDMKPLSDAIRISVTVHEMMFKDMVMKYQKDFLKTSAQIEFDNFIKDVMVEVRKMMSTSYIKKITKLYFTDYGLILIIHDALKTLFMAQYNDISESF